jgi:hypothetical protein
MGVDCWKKNLAKCSRSCQNAEQGVGGAGADDRSPGRSSQLHSSSGGGSSGMQREAQTEEPMMMLEVVISPNKMMMMMMLMMMNRRIMEQKKLPTMMAMVMKQSRISERWIHRHHQHQTTGAEGIIRLELSISTPLW